MAFCQNCGNKLADGAEKCYGMPLGDEFSLDIFTSDKLKEKSKQQ